MSFYNIIIPSPSFQFLLLMCGCPFAINIYFFLLLISFIISFFQMGFKQVEEEKMGVDETEVSDLLVKGVQVGVDHIPLLKN